MRRTKRIIEGITKPIVFSSSSEFEGDTIPRRNKGAISKARVFG
jgi:hypothetical protein